MSCSPISTHYHARGSPILAQMNDLISDQAVDQDHLCQAQSSMGLLSKFLHFEQWAVPDFQSMNFEMWKTWAQHELNEKPSDLEFGGFVGQC
ncbi:hypothetical protein DPMN_054161 [Dreissena polymorpha]|uniref:Uncharacterized protein n=1 Tax=Dreissena polymorpha TaxID=45954 RepID=A0A9D4CQ11_DREPO|nr:hypothetical protein DPMN_054161 [Dreissena polymorpha]